MAEKKFEVHFRKMKKCVNSHKILDMKYILTFLWIAIYSSSAFGQVNSFAFSQSMDSYQTISGTVVDAPNQDDVFHANLPICFNFFYH